jgi:hypothetical protein
MKIWEIVKVLDRSTNHAADCVLFTPSLSMIRPASGRQRCYLPILHKEK